MLFIGHATAFSPPQEAAGEGIPILLLGNKMDMDKSREVPVKEAEKLAQVSSRLMLGGAVVHAPLLTSSSTPPPQENQVMFSEVSAYTSRNVTESLTHLAR